MPRWAAPALVGILSLPLGGCVERYFTVKSDPPGARVSVDDVRVGVTPCEVPFTWYGERRIAVESKGYQGVQEMVSFTPPWWQWLPLDFLTDVLVPFTLTDAREVTVVLRRAEISPQELDEVKARAAELRGRAGLDR